MMNFLKSKWYPITVKALVGLGACMCVLFTLVGIFPLGSGNAYVDVRVGGNYQAAGWILNIIALIFVACGVAAYFFKEQLSFVKNFAFLPYCICGAFLLGFLFQVIYLGASVAPPRDDTTYYNAWKVGTAFITVAMIGAIIAFVAFTAEYLIKMLVFKETASDPLFSKFFSGTPAPKKEEPVAVKKEAIEEAAPVEEEAPAAEEANEAEEAAPVEEVAPAAEEAEEAAPVEEEAPAAEEAKEAEEAAPVEEEAPAAEEEAAPVEEEAPAAEEKPKAAPKAKSSSKKK